MPTEGDSQDPVPFHEDSKRQLQQQGEKQHSQHQETAELEAALGWGHLQVWGSELL